MTSCPACEAVIDVEEEDIEEGQTMDCPECGAELEVVNTNPVELDVSQATLDLSHTAVSDSDAIEMAKLLGPRLTHVHLADGTKAGLPDEHLAPGRGNQPCRELLELLPEMGYSGMVVVEISTRRALNATQRYTDLAESLRFAKAYLPSARVSH